VFKLLFRHQWWQLSSGNQNSETIFFLEATPKEIRHDKKGTAERDGVELSQPGMLLYLLLTLPINLITVGGKIVL
jgi:hypothetical protein